jgi:protein TonB
MNVSTWINSESGRLSSAALLAVVMHLSLAALPVNWRPALPTPTVLRVTLTAPPSLPTPPLVPSVATMAPVVAPSLAAAPPAPSPTIQPQPAAPFALVNSPPKTVKVPPKREPPKPPAVARTKQEPAKQPVAAAPPKPAPPVKTQPLKPVAPPVIVAKTPVKDKKVAMEHPERARRLASAKPATADADSMEDFDSPTRFHSQAPLYRRAADADFESASDRGKPVRSVAQSSSGELGGGSASTVSATAARSAPVEVSLRPLPGNPQPRYPSEARQRGIEGKVVLRLTVSAAGSVEAASVARSSGNDLLDQEARATVMRWRFQPLAGPKVAQIPISFRLQN